MLNIALILFIKSYQKMVFSLPFLPRSLKIFINVFAFLYVKVNSKEICEEISFPSFSKNADLGIFVEIQS